MRKLVTVNLWDDDKGLDVSDSLVATFDNVVTEDDAETTIREILMNLNVGEALAKHNEKRATLTNKDILQRTGNKVNLEPVKLKNLRWEVV